MPDSLLEKKNGNWRHHLRAGRRAKKRVATICGLSYVLGARANINIWTINLWAAKEQLHLSLRQHFKSGEATKEKQRESGSSQRANRKSRRNKREQRGKSVGGAENGKWPGVLSLGLAESGLL